MNFIQTFYIDPSKHPFTDGFGWIKPEYHLMSWALSCLQLKELHGNVELFANSAGAELLIDKLQLPYTIVHTNHDDLVLADARLWALPKIYTYSLQEKPFLHIDGDVFLFEKLPAQLLQSHLIAQNLEVATEYYISTQKQLIDNFSYFPPCVNTDFHSEMPINAVNAGILGGYNLSFIKLYTTEAFEYVNRNIRHFKNVNVDKFNVFFEQHLFHSLAKEQNISIKFLFNEIIEDRGYLYLGNFQEVPFVRNYLHLLGHYKRDETTCMQMSTKLRELYPEYYYRIISLCLKNHVRLFTGFYNDKAIETKKDYQQLNLIATDCFKHPASTNNSKRKVSEPNISFLDFLLNYHLSEVIQDSEKQRYKDDCKIFSENLTAALKQNTTLSENYLYGRDLSFAKWYAQVFTTASNIQHISFVQTEGLHIIESSFNWAGLFNKHYRVGIQYYNKIKVSEGLFFNLVVTELINLKFLLHDIDVLGKTVLELLSEPRNINDLMAAMPQYFEENVILYNSDALREYLIKIISQLFLFKAIKPINLESFND